jgi:hypothetical protein
MERASGSARTAAGRTGHRLSPDEVRIMIDGGKPAVYERIFGRKAGKMIWGRWGHELGLKTTKICIKSKFSGLNLILL